MKWGLTGDCEAYAYLAGKDSVTSTVAGAAASSGTATGAETVPSDEQEKYVQNFSALKDSLHALGVTTDETQQLFSVIAGNKNFILLFLFVYW